MRPHLECCIQNWAASVQETEAYWRVPWRVTEMVKGLEHPSSEDGQSLLGLSSLEEHLSGRLSGRPALSLCLGMKHFNCKEC